MSLRRGRGGTGVGVQTVSTETVLKHTELAHSDIYIVEFWLCREGVLCSHVHAKKRRSEERGQVCRYVRVTLILQHVPLLTLEGKIYAFPRRDCYEWNTHSVRLEPT